MYRPLNLKGAEAIKKQQAFIFSVFLRQGKKDALTVLNSVAHLWIQWGFGNHANLIRRVIEEG